MYFLAELLTLALALSEGEELGDGGTEWLPREHGTELTAPSYLASCPLFFPLTDLLFVLAKVFVLRARLGFFSLA